MVSYQTIRWAECQATFMMEIVTRFILSFIYFQLEIASPFERKIHAEEFWLYKNPSTGDYVPVVLLWPILLIPTIIIFLVYYLHSKDKTELIQALLALSLALGLNGIITDVIKLIVGRPRPDFLYRCFPDGVFKWPPEDPDSGLGRTEDITSSCTGNVDEIREGRKSFPSGHSSASFCSLGFLSLWLCGKLHVLSSNRGYGWRVILVLLPIMTATVIALSRTCDYHHHWQDVVVGSVLGLLVSYTCYRQYYPSLSSPHSHLCLLTSNSLPPLPLQHNLLSASSPSHPSLSHSHLSSTSHSLSSSPLISSPGPSKQFD